MRSIFSALLVLALHANEAFGRGFEFVTLHYPGARHTFAHAIDDGIIVGAYSDTSSTYPLHGFIYDGQSFTTLDYPGSASTTLSDIEGDRIVGHYDVGGLRHGFIFESGMFTTVDHPLTSPHRNGSQLAGISGNKIVGIYMDEQTNTHGFLIDGTTFKTIDHPLGAITTSSGIEGNNIVGTYGTGGRTYSYIYDGVNFTTVNHPLSGRSTLALDISGSTVVGYFSDSALAVHGFTFDGLNYTTLDVPASLGRGTIAHGIQGRIIVGQYQNNSGEYRGFVFVPEPYSAVSIMLGALIAMAIPRRVSRLARAQGLPANCERGDQANARSWSS